MNIFEFIFGKSSTKKTFTMEPEETQQEIVLEEYKQPEQEIVPEVVPHHLNKKFNEFVITRFETRYVDPSSREISEPVSTFINLLLQDRELAKGKRRFELDYGEKLTKISILLHRRVALQGVATWSKSGDIPESEPLSYDFPFTRLSLYDKEKCVYYYRKTIRNYMGSSTSLYKVSKEGLTERIICLTKYEKAMLAAVTEYCYPDRLTEYKQLLIEREERRIVRCRERLLEKQRNELSKDIL